MKLSATETKTGPPYVAAVPPELTSYLDCRLGTYRPRLQTFARSDAQGGIEAHLGLNRYGRPTRSAAIRQQIEIRTKQAFGRHVWPHLFRDCAVTELVDCAPEEIGIAPDALVFPALLKGGYQSRGRAQRNGPGSPMRSASEASRSMRSGIRT